MDHNQRLMVILSHLNVPAQSSARYITNATSESIMDVKAMATDLIMARCSKSVVNNVEKFPIPDLETCYAVLNEMIVQPCALGQCIGWKAGITDVAAYTKLGLKAPFRAPLFGKSIIKNHSGLLLPSYLHDNDITIEAEFGVKINRDFKPTTGGYTKEEVIAGISQIIPSIEVCGNRFSPSLTTSLFQKLADHGVNMAVVVGKSLLDINSLAPSLKSTKVTLEIEGSVCASGTGANVLGDPLEALTWLVNTLGGSNITLKKNSFIITGAAAKCTARKGQTITAKFSGLGDVHVTLL